MPNALIRHALAATFLFIASVASIPVHAQSWPDRPVKIVVPFPPGGSVDVLARLLSARLSDALGQRFFIENKSGASGSVGLEFVANSPPDGYTFVMAADASEINPTMMPRLPYNTLEDFAPVMLVGTAPLAIVTAQDQPYKTFAEVVAAAKAAPDTITYGTTGVGSLGQLAMLLLGQIGGFKMVHVPYSGGGPMVVDVMAKGLTLGVASVATMFPFLTSGRLRCLGLTDDSRLGALPDVPTLTEQGFPKSSALVPWFLLAPAKTPKVVIDKIHAELAKILNISQVRQQLTEQLGMHLLISSPEAELQWMSTEIPRWAKVIKDNHIQPD